MLTLVAVAHVKKRKILEMAPHSFSVSKIGWFFVICKGANAQLSGLSRLFCSFLSLKSLNCNRVSGGTSSRNFHFSKSIIIAVELSMESLVLQSEMHLCKQVISSKDRIKHQKQKLLTVRNSQI